jgi:protein involved in ribonucleotide reduction
LNILEALNKFDLKGQHSKLEVVRNAIKAMWNKEKLESLNQRLAEV